MVPLICPLFQFHIGFDSTPADFHMLSTFLFLTLNRIPPVGMQRTTRSSFTREDFLPASKLREEIEGPKFPGLDALHHKTRETVCCCGLPPKRDNDDRGNNMPSNASCILLGCMRLVPLRVDMLSFVVVAVTQPCFSHTPFPLSLPTSLLSCIAALTRPVRVARQARF